MDINLASALGLSYTLYILHWALKIQVQNVSSCKTLYHIIVVEKKDLSKKKKDLNVIFKDIFTAA